MNTPDCKSVRFLLHAILDGELDLATELEVREHLKNCQACAREFQNLQTLKASVKNASLYYEAPEQLKRKALTSISRPETAKITSSWMWKWGSLAASFIVVFLFVRLFIPSLTGKSNQEELSQEVLSDHLRSLAANHLVDVVSTDQHTVKPWFNGKLAFSPPVTDFAKEGFPLVGGRLDYLQGKPVAAIVYRRRKHLINLFVWPVAGATQSEGKISTNQGYHLIHWTENGMAYWAVSDVNVIELQEFVKLVQ